MPGLLDFREVCWKVTKFIQVEMNFLTQDLFLKFYGKSIYVLLIEYSTPPPGPYNNKSSTLLVMLVVNGCFKFRSLCIYIVFIG